MYKRQTGGSVEATGGSAEIISQDENATLYAESDGIDADNMNDSGGMSITGGSTVTATGGAAAVDGGDGIASVSYTNLDVYKRQVIYGPGHMEVCHSDKEYIDPRQITECYRVYTRMAAAFCRQTEKRMAGK